MGSHQRLISIQIWELGLQRIGQIDRLLRDHSHSPEPRSFALASRRLSLGENDIDEI
jgi:hypothetical protein